MNRADDLVGAMPTSADSTLPVAGVLVPPYAVQLEGSRFAAAILRLIGWTVDFEGLPARQGVIVVYPHTSNWDFPVLVLAKWAVGLQLSFWGKDSLFEIPVFGRWLRWIGGMPVRRDAPGGVVGQMATHIKTCKQDGRYFWLGLSPEGTRKRTAGWRSGFYFAAVQAEVPLGLVQLDFARRQICATQFLQLTGDADSDFRRLAEAFEGVQGKTPSSASPVLMLDSSAITPDRSQNSIHP